MSPFRYFKTCCTKKYADFSGRARRSEYWYFTLFSYLFMAACFGIDMLLLDFDMDNDEAIPMLTVLAFLVYIIPALAVTVRRLHDINKSGWWIFIRIIPYVGDLILFVFSVMDSDPNHNEYGPNPKGEKILEPIDHLIDDDF